MRLPLRICSREFVSSCPPSQWRTLQKEWAAQSCLRLPHFLDGSLARALAAQIRKGRFFERRDRGIARESCMKKDKTFSFLHFLMNDERLFAAIEKITGCGRIRSFTGRLYRFSSGDAHYDSWHDDLGNHRRVGVSINLSRGKYAGGIFQIRRGSKILHEVQNHGFGDAVLFQLGNRLKHRVTPVTGRIPRVAFAGWFCARPSFLDLIQ